MLKQLYISGVVLLAAFVLSSAMEVRASSRYKIGTYNIRIITTSDTGDKSWNNRKEYVARTITESGYDVIGINEMVTGQQEQDLRALLPDYTMVAFGYSIANVPEAGQKDAIAFRPEKFDLLDNGHYFVGPDTDKPGEVWDASPNDRRVAVWVKLRTKDTGEIFYYFATHLDHLGSDARNEGARVTVEMMRKIAGHYPVVITGDHNSSPIRYPYYDMMDAYLDDSRKVTVTPFPWPKDGTLNKWNPDTKDGSRLDYVWVKGMTVHSYNHINETFGRSVTPSDHFPIIAEISLQPYVADHTRYVDIHAAEGGDGSKESPYRNLQDAIDATCVGDTIYVTQGTYVVPSSKGLTGRKATFNVTHSLDIFGGYDSDFNEVVGRSILTGDLSDNDKVADGVISGNEENAYRVVTVQKGCALSLCNFEVTGGNADGDFTTGGGIACLGSRLVLDNVVVKDNRTEGEGAGVYAAGQLLCTDCRFINNEAGAFGGAYYAAYPNVELWWRHAMTRCYFEGNKATQGSAGYHGGYSWAYFGANTYVGNKASYGGTVSLNGTTYESKATFVNNTFTGNSVEATGGIINDWKGGAAIYANLNSASVVSLVNNTIVGNRDACYKNGTITDTFQGAAVYLYNCTAYVYNNLIAGNRSTSKHGGDLFYGGRSIATGYNVFSSEANFNIKPTSSDMTASSLDEAIAFLGNMLSGKVVDGNFVARLDWNGGHVETIGLKDCFFGNKAVNVVPATQLDEKLLNADIDNTLEIRDKLLYDQRGELRFTDGTSSIGAYEYGRISELPSIETETKAVTVHCDESLLTVSTTQCVRNARMVDMNGRVIGKIGDIEPGTTSTDISYLSCGLYILAWDGGACKFLKH